MLLGIVAVRDAVYVDLGVFVVLFGEGIASLTWISEVRFCMIAQMSLVSLSVKLALLPGVVGVLRSSIVRAGMTDGRGDGVWFFNACEDVRIQI